MQFLRIAHRASRPAHTIPPHVTRLVRSTIVPLTLARASMPTSTPFANRRRLHAALVAAAMMATSPAAMAIRSERQDDLRLDRNRNGPGQRQ